MRSEVPTAQSFGWVFTAFFTLVGAYSLWRGGTIYPWMLGLATVTAAVTMARPEWLAPLNRFRCFMGTEIETLAAGNRFLRKERENPALRQNYENKFEFD